MTPAPKQHQEEAPLFDTAARILHAAEALFSEFGFDAVSMNTIAEHAGVSKANVFHHFSSKNALYIAVLKDACQQSTALLQAMAQERGPLPERLANFARAHLENVLEREQVSRIILQELLKGGPKRGQELAQQVFGEHFARFVDMLRRGQEDGELRSDIDPAMVAVLILSANVFFFQAQPVLRHFPEVAFAEDPGRYSAALLDLVLHGILRHPGATP